MGYYEKVFPSSPNYLRIFLTIFEDSSTSISVSFPNAFANFDAFLFIVLIIFM